MFVGFIAVIVILLIIVGLMSTGAGSAGGGVDQTKVTKIVSEISTISQNLGFYKSSVDTADFTGITVTKAVESGIIDSANVKTVDTDVDLADLDQDSEDGGVFKDNPIATADKLIRSEVNSGVYYALVDVSGNVSIQVVVDTTLVDADFRKTLESTLLTKLAPGAEAYQDGNTDEDGQISLNFK